MSHKAIIIGATSGIGAELTKLLHMNGYTVGATGRRTERLTQLAKDLQTQVHTKAFDVTSTNAQQELQALISEMGGVELVVICAATGDLNLNWDAQKNTIDTNVLGFAAMSNFIFQYFSEKGSGHLVGISSIGAIRGGAAPAYNASKAFVSNYLQGLRLLAAKRAADITITQIQPGFVATQMAQGDNLFWLSSPEKAASQIYSAIVKKRKHAYVSKRWRLIAYLLKILPDYFYHKL